MPLSGVDTARFQGAFFRFELYSKNFSAKEDPESCRPEQSMSPTIFQSREFIAKIEPWAAEEMACAQQYFICRIAKLYDKPEDESVRELQRAVGVKKPHN